MNRYVSRKNYFDKYVEFTNLSDSDLLYFSLVKKGYGTLNEIKELDTKELLDIIEYEAIMSDIETLTIDDAKNGNDI